MKNTRNGRSSKGRGTVGWKERFKDERHDPYRERVKPPEPARCPGCGSVFAKGRWSWQSAPDAPEVLCPACRRIEASYPAGVLSVGGGFFTDHRDEVLNLIRNVEQTERAEHPLERLMAITDEDGTTLVTTTGVHLARRIGDALTRAYQGNLTVQYAESEHFVRVVWMR